MREVAAKATELKLKASSQPTSQQLHLKTHTDAQPPDRGQPKKP